MKGPRMIRFASLFNCSHFIGIQAAQTSPWSTSYVFKLCGGVSSVIHSSVVNRILSVETTPNVLSLLLLRSALIKVALPWFDYNHSEDNIQSVFIFFTGV